MVVEGPTKGDVRNLKIVDRVPSTPGKNGND